MALTQTPLTELDAVNEILMSIGQSPVNSLDSTGIKDVETGRLRLHNTSREVQSQGWAFNTDYQYEISPDGNDRILIPSNALSLDPTYNRKDFVWRYDSANDKSSLYDLNDQTFDITEKVKVDIIWFYEFEHLPPTARNYIALLAGQRFQSGIVGDELLYRFEQADVDRAEVAFKRAEGRARDINMLTGGDFTNTIFNRRRNPRR